MTIPVVYLKAIILTLCISVSYSLKLVKNKVQWIRLYSDKKPQSTPTPFDADDFIRDDALLKRSPPPEPYKPPPKKVKPSEEEREYDPRPTGYANWDAEDEAEEEEARRLKEQYEKDKADSAEIEEYVERSETEKLLSTLSNGIRDLLVDSEYDSKRTKSARSVVKSITFLSFLIGAVFTLVYYAFPGKFISFRGNTDFNERYTNVYVDPNDLLKENFPSNRVDNGENFDDIQPPIKEQTRFEPSKRQQSAPYGRSEEL